MTGVHREVDVIDTPKFVAMCQYGNIPPYCLETPALFCQFSNYSKHGGWGDKCRLLSALLLSGCFKISDEYSTFFRFFENFSFWNVFQISKLFIF